jgi:hypothetical protein
MKGRNANATRKEVMPARIGFSIGDEKPKIRNSVKRGKCVISRLADRL